MGLYFSRSFYVSFIHAFTYCFLKLTKLMVSQQGKVILLFCVSGSTYLRVKFPACLAQQCFDFVEPRNTLTKDRLVPG